MKSYEKLLLENKAWATEKVDSDPDYFKRLAKVQTPEFLWIGCSDSRVPANEITGTQPGEIFVHRNIANMVIHTDINLLSVLDYAVNFLKVNHVVVCGHYGCGGVKASMTNNDYKALLNMWIRSIKDVYRHNREELEAIEDMDARGDRLSELNVMEQVVRLSQTTIIQNAWKERRAPDLHGWVYGLKDGLINPVMEIKAGTPVDPLYSYHDF
ncbi:MAG TPA: carbonic anhydrase [Agriterribacter sp.]|nr:carbonic anhydrase [Agriterribacter sp.]